MCYFRSSINLVLSQYLGYFELRTDRTDDFLFLDNMADRAPASGGDRGGFRGGFGDRGRGGRGRGRGRGGRGGRGGRNKEEKDWVPVTKLGRLVKDGKIKSLEEIYLYSLPIKEHEIIDMFIGPALKDEVLKIMPVQKQTRAGQRTRFKAFVGESYRTGETFCQLDRQQHLYVSTLKSCYYFSNVHIITMHRETLKR